MLTLSATPIPRTMSMALSGLRDMSVIEDPPEGRMPVLTYVREYDDDMIRDAILRELERDGQIYFVHNKIESIYHVAQHLKKLVPDAAHRGRARADVGGRTGAGDVRLLPPQGRHSALHHHHRKRPGHPQRQHHHHRQRRPHGPVAVVPVARARGALQPAGVRLLPLSAQQAADGGRARSDWRRSRSSPRWAAATRSPCATWRYAARATCSAREQHGRDDRAWASTCTRNCWRRPCRS